MFGIDFSDPRTFWLNVTNIVLGLVTLACVLAVAGSIVWEFVRRRQLARAQGPTLDDHAIQVAGLGLTMADGGRKLDGKGR